MAKKTSAKTGELVFGIQPIKEALKARRRKIISIYTTKPEPKAWKELERLLPKYPVAIQYVKRDVLHKIAGTTDHQGILAWVQPFGYRKKFFDVKKQPFLVMLDGIQDPRNLGAIIRSAYCTGVDGVIITKKEGVSINATVLKASAGLAEYMEIYQAASAPLAVQELQKAGYTLYLTTFKGEDATTCAFKEPLCIVIGSEGTGISKNIMHVGEQITLPQRSKDISYNASVAAGIVLFLAATKNKKL